MSIRLSRAEAWEMLAEAHTGIFTSLRADGAPITWPVWFVAMDERIYIDAVARTKKVARIRRDPRVSFLVESGTRWRELCSVQLTGRATVLEDPAVEARARTLLRAKYAGFAGDRPAMPAATRAHYAAEHLMIEVVPDERILSFDNARIPLGPPGGTVADA